METYHMDASACDNFGLERYFNEAWHELAFENKKDGCILRIEQSQFGYTSNKIS